MLRLTFKNLVANRLRFAMTTFAVVLAVSFVVSSFVLTDGLRSSFNSLSAEIVDGTDFEIRPVSETGSGTTLDESLVDKVANIDGVLAAAPIVEAENSLFPINADSEPIPVNGPPQLVFGWVDDPKINRFTLVEGRAPGSDGEMTMDIDSAARHGFEIGQTYDLVSPTGLSSVTLTGLVSFGADNDTMGATLMQMEVSNLQSLIRVDTYSAIAVATEPGVDKASIESSLASVAPGIEVIDNATLESEQRAEFNQGIDLIGYVLLGFAAVSLFVSIFIIYNTFSIVLGQRTRELALLRTVGADPAQLGRSVLGEATIVGALASIIGIGAGVGVAAGLRSLFNAIGAQMPNSPLTVSMRTIAVAVVVGVGATVVSAIGPARKASRVPVMAALNGGVGAGAMNRRTRLAVGAVLSVAGLAIGAAGLFAATTTTMVLSLLAMGAMGFFVGVTMLSPLVAVPVVNILGYPGRVLAGVPGRLAQHNAARNPQRTATTAAALMIGLAMVTMALTVGDSVKAQLRVTLGEAVHADYLITDNETGNGFTNTIRPEVEALAQTAIVTAFRYDEAQIGEQSTEATQTTEILATDMAASAELFDLGLIDGVAYDATVTNPVLVSNEAADETNIKVGEQLTMTFGSGDERTLTVIGIYTDDIIADARYLLDLSTWDAVGNSQTDMWLAVSIADGVDAAQAEKALATIAERYPLVSVNTFDDYVQGIEGLVDQALTAVNVMVALAVIIAFIGIANTLALSVFERTRELGLLRAVGMSRRQLRRMVRFEAALVALFGAVLGVGVGLLFGWAVVAALPSFVTSTLSVPTQRIIVLMLVAGVAGLVAALGPARRAGRLNILDAIVS